MENTKHEETAIKIQRKSCRNNRRTDILNNILIISYVVDKIFMVVQLCFIYIPFINYCCIFICTRISFNVS